MYFKFHIHWLRSYKIIILPFNFHFRNSGWAHCWEPSQSQRNSPQWLSCAWTAQELSTKSSWCCSWAGPLPGCNGSFQEVQILLSTLCFVCDWMNVLLDFLSRACQKRGGQWQKVGWDLNAPKKICMDVCVSPQPGRKEVRTKHTNFWRYSPNWLLSMAVSELEHILGNANLHTVLAGRLQEWAPGSSWCWDK